MSAPRTIYLHRTGISAAFRASSSLTPGHFCPTCLPARCSSRPHSRDGSSATPPAWQLCLCRKKIRYGHLQIAYRWAGDMQNGHWNVGRAGANVATSGQENRGKSGFAFPIAKLPDGCYVRWQTDARPWSVQLSLPAPKGSHSCDAAESKRRPSMLHHPVQAGV